jgi:hypothetical protein
MGATIQFVIASGNSSASELLAKRPAAVRTGQYSFEDMCGE